MYILYREAGRADAHGRRCRSGLRAHQLQDCPVPAAAQRRPSGQACGQQHWRRHALICRPHLMQELINSFPQSLRALVILVDIDCHARAFGEAFGGCSVPHQHMTGSARWLRGIQWSKACAAVAGTFLRIQVGAAYEGTFFLGRANLFQDLCCFSLDDIDALASQHAHHLTSIQVLG